MVGVGFAGDLSAGTIVGYDNIQITLILSQFPGDVNGDGFVGGADLSTIMDNWGLSPADWEDGDIDPFDAGDDFIGGPDYTQVLNNWGTSYGPEPVPEPATLGLV